MDEELDALISVEPPASQPGGAPTAVDRILTSYRSAKRELELLDTQEALGIPQDYDVERHMVRERMRALKYDLTVAVRTERLGE